MAVTKIEADGAHPPSHYLIVEDPEHPSTWHLRVRDADGSVNHNLMGAAWAALHGGYRGDRYEGPGKQTAIAKLKALYRSQGMDLPDSTSSDGQAGNAAGGPTNLNAGGRWVDSQLSGCLAADLPRLVVLLAEPPAKGMIRIPIAITGKWRGAEKEFSIGLDDLQEIRANFAKKHTGEINVDYEHASEAPFGTGGPVLSAGRIVKLDEPEVFKNGSGQVGSWANGGLSGPAIKSGDPTSPSAKYILWGWYEPTERARQLIALREYRYISPAIRWGARDKVTGKTVGTVLTSVALVNKPFLEELPQIGPADGQSAGGQVEKQADEQMGSGQIAGLQSAPAFKSGGPISPSAVFSESVGGQKVFVSLGQLHVPGPVNEVSVAYGQPGESRSRESRTQEGNSSTSRLLDSSTKKEGKMATKSLKLKCLTDEHLEKHGLGPEHKGKIGVFDGEELIGVAPPPEGWGPAAGEDDGIGENGKKLAERFAAEIGLPGTSFVDIAALVKRGREAQLDQFAALSESIHDGRINLLEAGRLADAGRVKFSTILQAQEAERKVEAAVRAGKVLPKNRAYALKLAFSDTACFAALIEQSKPVVDLRAHGHAGGGEQPTAQQVLMGEVKAYAKEHQCSVSVALSEVTKTRPDLWREYSDEIVVAVEGAQDEE